MYLIYDAQRQLDANAAQSFGGRRYALTFLTNLLALYNRRTTNRRSCSSEKGGPNALCLTNFAAFYIKPTTHKHSYSYCVGGGGRYDALTLLTILRTFDLGLSCTHPIIILLT